MKILILEHPRIESEEHFNDIANTPLWSCLMCGYAAAAITGAGYDADFLDASGESSFGKLTDTVLNDDYGLICVNAVYMWENTDALFAFLESLREKGYTGHINLFGFFPTLAYKVLLNACYYIDSVSVGECEKSLVELAGCIQNSGDFSDVQGIACRKDGDVILKPRNPELDPDVFLFPERRSRADETAVLLGSRGCYNHCSFCLIPSFYNNGALWRVRSPENIIQEIMDLKDKGYDDFYFADANFIGPGKRGRQHTVRFLNMLSELNIKYGMETRANDIDPDMAKLLRSSGLSSLLIGVESGSGRLLSGLSKHADTVTSERAIAILRDVGIEPEIGFLMFVPDSTIEDIEANFSFLKRNGLLDRLDRTVNLLCHRQIVFMGTSGYARFENEGRLFKKGFLGFEGIINFKDEKVKTLCDIITQECHSVLRNIGDSGSEIYFNRNNPEAKQKVNDHLVYFFEHALDIVTSSTHLLYCKVNI